MCLPFCANQMLNISDVLLYYHSTPHHDVLLYYHSTPHHDAVRELHQDRTLIKNILLGQTLHGDGIYVTIFWTSNDCNGQVDFGLHLSVGQLILFPYFDH